MKYVLCLFAAAFSLQGHAKAVQTQADSFDAIAKQVAVWGKPANTLVVMDNDDTLSTMSCPDPDDPRTCQYLGGAAWFSWQEELVKNKQDPRVADSMGELIDASDLLFALNNMVYTRKNVPEVLKSLTDKKVRLLVETARGGETVSATENQFANLPTSAKGTLGQLVAANSLSFGAIASKPSPYTACNNSRPVTYRQGVLYLAGQDKGNNLKCLLTEYAQSQPSAAPVTHIVFIDDTPGNVVSVYNAFKDEQAFDVTAIHYTALSAHKKAFTQGDKAAAYQAEAMLRWCNVVNTLGISLLKPSYKQMCDQITN